MRKAAFSYDYPAADGDVFGDGRRERVARLVALHPTVITASNFDEHAGALAAVEDEVGLTRGSLGATQRAHN
jgi:hypothetical protein